MCYTEASTVANEYNQLSPTTTIKPNSIVQALGNDLDLAHLDPTIIVSPDTDVYHIGLALPCVTQKQVLLQMSTVNSHQLNLTAYVQALGNDLDLAHLDPIILPQVFQTLYPASGCDYISFFSQVDKATFLRYFFRYASFVSSGNEHPGTLADTDLAHGSYEEGFRLFDCIRQAFSPAAHFQSFRDPNSTVQQQYSSLLDDIRQTTRYCVKFENEMVPSDEALLLHWKCTCWVIHM